MLSSFESLKPGKASVAAVSVGAPASVTKTATNIQARLSRFQAGFLGLKCEMLESGLRAVLRHGRFRADLAGGCFGRDPRRAPWGWETLARKAGRPGERLPARPGRVALRQGAESGLPAGPRGERRERSLSYSSRLSYSALRF